MNTTAPTPTSTGSATAPATAPSRQRLREDLLALAELTRATAEHFGRADLVERVERAAARVAERELTVLVAGEFKQGKSTLVNALLNAAVCPVADEVSTVVPTIIRYGEEATATVVYHAADGTAPSEAIPFDQIALRASEQGNPGNREGIRSVEVTVPRKLLQAGLAVVDTPGVGGLDSTHGAATSSALGIAEVLVFVSDVSQPLSRSELSFLTTARQRCPQVILVQTKTDIYPRWRDVVEINRRYLAEAGLPVEILAVSSVLRQRATRDNDSALNEESGYPRLLVMLRDTATGESSRRAARVALGDLDFVIEQLRAPFASEKELLEDPGSSATVLARLDDAKARAEHLRSRSAKWQQTLNDGVQDLMSDLDHDMRVRIRGVIAESDHVFDEQDPSKVWDGFEQWLHQRLAFDLAAHHQYLAARANELAGTVADHFAEDEHGIDVPLQLAVPRVEARVLRDEIDLKRPSLAGNALAAVRGSYGGLLMFGMFGQMIGLAAMNPLTVVIGLGLGRKTLREEKKRQLLQRQQQAKIAVRKYVDDINLEAGKLSRDTMRTVQRGLRDEFSGRAEQMQTTIRETIRSAETIAKQAAVEQQQRLAEVKVALDRIAPVQRKLDALASSLPALPSAADGGAAPR